MNNSPKELNLGKWEFEVIKFVKSSQPRTIAGLHKIWAERCALDVKYMESHALVSHFLPIVLKIGELSGSNSYKIESIVEDAAPNNRWKFNNSPEIVNGDNTPTQDYYDDFLRVIASRLRLTEVKYLNGYVKYLEEKKEEKMS